MKLITEYIEDAQYLIEGSGASKNVYLTGVFMQAERKNRNGRVYPKRILEPALQKYVTEQVETGRAVGELGHPEGPTVNLDKVSHKLCELYWDGDNVMGKALILNTPMGNIVKGLIEGGVKLGVSSRGMGTLARINGSLSVKEDFILNTIDIVQNPSAPEAFVNGIMENYEFFVNGTEIIRSEVKSKQKSLSEEALSEMQFSAFQQLLTEISGK